MKLFNKGTVLGEKKSFLENIRKDPKKPLSFIGVSLRIILPFCICLLLAFMFTLNYIRTVAYTYDNDTYKGIEEVLCGVKVTLPNGKVELQNPKITLPDGTVEEIMPCLVKGEGIDYRTLQQYLYAHGGKYENIYENGQTQLTCSIKNGYFDAVVTVWLNNNFEITQMTRNYNSLGAYMDRLIRQIGLASLGIALAVFLGVELLIFGGLAVYGKLYNWQADRKKKNEETEASLSASDGPSDQNIQMGIINK